MLNETWRPDGQECDVLHNGHLWFGSGGEAGKHGVGVLLHKDLGRYVHRWVAINSRLGVLELTFNNSLKISLIVVYMPHAGYSDGAVQAVYEELSNLVRAARAKKSLLVIAGDWNAEVSSCPQYCASLGHVGPFANPEGNERGDGLAGGSKQNGCRWRTHFLRNDGVCDGHMRRTAGSGR
eukprot:2322722-Karenia_brevis.AAC.1